MAADGDRQRLAAILVADAVGFSRLMADDERATVAALDAARHIFRSGIEACGGRVIDTAGDSILAIFDTVAGAVRAAICAQRDLESSSVSTPENRRLRFRIGIHLGDVLEKQDGTIYGDGVNIAARLQTIAAPAGIAVSDSVRNAARGKTDASFEECGEQFVKGIVEPVRVFRIRSSVSTVLENPAMPTSPGLALPDKPSIAVLPFINMSGDAEQEFFTDGVTEDIITELSRFHSLFVIARNTTFTYKGKAVDVCAFARELGVRYVLEGSIRRSGARIRVTGQLIDGFTGNHLWAERYDRVVEDVFAVQEELTQSIVTAIAPQVDAAEREKARRRRPESLTAYEIGVRASANAWEALHRSDSVLRDGAVRDAKAALVIDPRSTVALNALACARFQQIWFKTSSEPQVALQEGLDAADLSTVIDPSDSQGYIWKGALLACAAESDRWDESLAALRAAHQLNGNDVNALLVLGWVEALAGKPVDGMQHVQQALRMSPKDPLRHLLRSQLALSCFSVKDYSKAVEYASLAANEAPNMPSPHLFAAIAHVGTGEMEKARACVQKLRVSAPEYLQSRLNGEMIMQTPELRQRVTTFLRIAADLENPEAAREFL